MRVIFLYTSFFLFVSYQMEAQNAVIDSLRNEISVAQVDTQRGYKMYLLAENFIKIGSFDSASIWSDQALAYATKIKHDRGIEKALYVKGNIFLYTSKFSSARDTYKKLGSSRILVESIYLS
jgi:hypothetical protein